MSIQSFNELFKHIVEREEKLGVLYGNLLQQNKNEHSRTFLKILKIQQDIALRTFRSITIKEYFKKESVKYPDDYQMEGILKLLKQSEHFSPEDLLHKVLVIEEKIEDYFRHVRDALVYSKSKAIFDMLVQFKMGQIKAVKSLIDSYDLVS